MLYIKGFLIVCEPYSHIKKHQKQLLVNRKLEASFLSHFHSSVSKSCLLLVSTSSNI